MKPFQSILDAISRRKGSWSLELLDGKVSLAVGAPNAIKVQGGTIAVIGLSRDELAKLRDAANEFLGIAKTDPAPPPVKELVMAATTCKCIDWTMVGHPKTAYWDECRDDSCSFKGTFHVHGHHPDCEHYDPPPTPRNDGRSP